MLRRDQFRAVHVHQRLAFFYRLAGRIDIEPLDPTLELRCHRVQAALIRLHRRHCPDGPCEFSQRDNLGFHPELLYFFGADIRY